VRVGLKFAGKKDTKAKRRQDENSGKFTCATKKVSKIQQLPNLL
jgi:hypothetical protein